jgi:hypothetical protein
MNQIVASSVRALEESSRQHYGFIFEGFVEDLNKDISKKSTNN